MMTAGSLFSGAGGFDLGLEQAGFTIVWQVEKDAHARKVLAKHWPTVEQFDDVCQFHGWSRGEGGIDCLPGGSEPNAQGCGEWNESSPMRVDCLVGGWPCQDLSVAGKRKGLAGERSGLFHEVIRIAKEIQPTWGLFENVPGLLSSHGGRDMATVLEGLRECWPVVGYRVLDSQYFGVAQRRRRVFFVCGPTERSVEEILFEPEGGEGHFTKSEKARPELAASLKSRSSSPGINPPGRGGEDVMNLVVDALTARDSKGYDRGDNSHNSKLIPIAEIGAKTQMGDGRNGCGIGMEGDPMFTLQAGKQHGVGVRRLTPTETERLQGFPDGWTCLCQPLESYDHLKCQCADGPRYRMMGNAVTVNVIRWLGKRIRKYAKGTT